MTDQELEPLQQHRTKGTCHHEKNWEILLTATERLAFSSSMCAALPSWIVFLGRLTLPMSRYVLYTTVPFFCTSTMILLYLVIGISTLAVTATTT